MKIKAILSFLLVISGYSTNATQLRIDFGIASHQNGRPYQEDRFTHASLHEGNFFGVYDGHGGADTSSFLQNNLHTYLTGPFFTMKQACEHAFSQTEEYVLKNYTDGSTALIVFIDHNNIMHCAWTGDTRAVLEKNSAVDFATRDHKPNDEQELLRIKQCGGRAIRSLGEVWRVGGLAVSRSIGDAQLKSMYPGQIIAVPEYATIVLHKDNHFMIMASDGLWDVISNEEAVALVNAMLQENKDLDTIAQRLQYEAIIKGSLDNITVCVVCFNWI